MKKPSTDFNRNYVKTLLSNDEKFPVFLDDFWTISGFSSKSLAKRLVKANLVQNVDFTYERVPNDYGRHIEHIYLTIEGAMILLRKSRTTKAKVMFKIFQEEIRKVPIETISDNRNEPFNGLSRDLKGGSFYFPSNGLDLPCVGKTPQLIFTEASNSCDKSDDIKSDIDRIITEVVTDAIKKEAFKEEIEKLFWTTIYSGDFSLEMKQKIIDLLFEKGE